MLAPLLVLCAAAAPQLPQASTADAGVVGFAQACLDATSDAVVLNVAAHPDDESARTMVLLRHKHGVRTVTLYSTCGEGGQNVIGPEIGRRLAALRVRETLAAAEHTGTEVRWLGFPDFGYSKSLEETLSVWGEAKLLDAMRAAVDAVAPDLVVTNHSIGGGHGHHRASAFAIEAACKERALPLYQRATLRANRAVVGAAARGANAATPSTGAEPAPAAAVPGLPTAAAAPRAAAASEDGDQTTPPEAAFRLDPGDFDAVRGATFARQAHTGWTRHLTQGPWGPHDPTRVSVDHWKQVVPEPSDRVGTHPLERLGSLFAEPAFLRAAARERVDTARLEAELDAFASDRARGEHIERARRLLPVLRGLEAAIDGDGAAGARRRLLRRIDALQRVVVAGAGLVLETGAVSGPLAIGATRELRVRLRGAPVADLAITCDGEPARPLERSRAREASTANAAEQATGPATRGARASTDDAAWFVVALRGEDSAAISVLDELTRSREARLRATFTLEGLPLSIEREVRLELAPELELAWDRDTALVPARGPWQRVLSLAVEYHGEPVRSERLSFRHPAGLTVAPIPAELELSGEQPRARVLVRVACGDGAEWRDPIELAASFGGSARGAIALVPFSLHGVTLPNVGLVRGPDDTAQRFLEDLAFPHEVLDEEALAVADLRAFDTVLLDIRAYHHRPDLAFHKDRLLEFCRAGGRVVALYHKPGEWNARAGKPLLAPFPLEVGNGRVAEEDAAVTLLEPEHPLWTRPFRITTADFEGWVQERGLNFPSKPDPAWLPLLEMKDTGEEPSQGALLYTRYGRGEFVYCSLVLYRQLREGHAGAARVMVNLLGR